MMPVMEIGTKVGKTLSARWFPWLVLGLVLIALLLREILNSALLEPLSVNGQVIFWVSALVLAGIMALILFRLNELYDQRESLKNRLREAESVVAESDQRLEAIFDVSQKFVEAGDENEVVEPVLRLLIGLIGAERASFVPLDEHGQPQTAISHGQMQLPVMNAWLEYLASPEVRHRCHSCESHESMVSTESCPLLMGPFADQGSIYCLPVRRGEIEYGVVTISISDPNRLDSRTRSFLRALLDETALGLESIRLRRRELAALREMQVLREKTDLKALLNSLLENIIRTLEVDFSVMLVKIPSQTNSKTVGGEILLTMGGLPDQAHPFIDGIMQGVMASKEPVLLGDVGGNPTTLPGMLTLIAVPLLLPERGSLGVILIGNRKSRRLNQRQLSLLQTIAGQVALVVQNARLMAELEYKTLMEERTRLAREIHDGIAQTLGFLKLQVAQMRNQLSRGEIDRVLQSTELCYTTLNEAYQEARQAIDGLRISPVESGIRGWLEQILQDFQEVTDIAIDIQDHELQTEIPAEIHVQLIRIVQEALSNVRKHAQASHVWVEYKETDDEFVLEVRDDGMGFSPEDISQPSRHGLRGMQERANLIGAEIKVISRPQEGTIVRLGMPLNRLKEVVL